jgi:hypothetical protein
MATYAAQVGFDLQTLEPGIKYFFKQGENGEIRLKGSEILKWEGSQKAKETIRSFSSFASMSQMQHGGVIPSDTLLPGYSTVFTHGKYGKVIGLDKESWDDDLYDVIRRTPELLGDSLRYTKELIAHAPFNLAFAAGGTVLGDGVSLINANHPLTKIGGVFSNVLGTPQPPSYGSYASLHRLLQIQKNSAGMPIDYQSKPKLWIVHPDYGDIARQVVGSSSGMYVQQTATQNANSNVINPWYGNVKVVESPYLTQNTSHFLMIASGHYGYFFTRTEANMPNVNDRSVWEEPNPEVVYAKVTLRASSGFADWRGIVGTFGV